MKASRCQGLPRPPIKGLPFREARERGHLWADLQLLIDAGWSGKFIMTQTHNEHLKRKIEKRHTFRKGGGKIPQR